MKKILFLFILYHNLGLTQSRPNWAPLPKESRQVPDRYGCVSYTEDQITNWTPGDYWNIFKQQELAINPHMASKEHRLYHYLWHAVRNGWNRFSLSQKQFFIDLDPKWNVPRPNDANDVSETLNNRSGEDFLYMHHYMVIHSQAILMSKGLPCISGWSNLPKPDDQFFSLITLNPWRSSQEYFNRMEEFFRNFFRPSYLRRYSLGSIGSQLESSLHNMMHLRWTADSSPFGVRRTDPISQMNNEFWVYNRPEYTLLSDSYSSHVNPIFYKLHVLVDDILYLWLKSNNYKKIEEDCRGENDCYQWVNNPFIGPFPSDLNEQFYEKFQTAIKKLSDKERNALLCNLDLGSFMDYGVDKMNERNKEITPGEYLIKYGNMLNSLWKKRNLKRVKASPDHPCSKPN